jgi:hypothetical protein
MVNLRDVSPRENKQNLRKPNRDNKAGLLGVSPNGKRWAAQVESNGRKFYLGTYDTPEEAHAKYLVAKRNLHAGCTL